MILLDKNNNPNNTVYYLSGVVYGILNIDEGIDYSQLYKKVISVQKQSINFEFYSLALDFLFLLNKIYLDEKGGLHVYKTIKN